MCGSARFSQLHLPIADVRRLRADYAPALELGNLKLRNVPCLIKDPPLRDIPVKESESLSPLALGFSMIIDYKTRKITFGKKLPEEKFDYELPMHLHRLATVRGKVDGGHPANFVVDTGGELISISAETASALSMKPARRIPLRVFGMSGIDVNAYLLPGVDVEFDEIEYRNVGLAVLNLRAPSVLLGFQVGGIVGHNFLSRYRVSIDVARSEVRLE